jgi:predicted DCC family thiol-disulfide oxidoreductase YuxK
MNYVVIYDGRCNLCSTLVQALEQLDRGKLFQYIPMQDETALSHWHVTAQDCEMGMMVIQANEPDRRWQGSDAAEEIARLLPIGRPFVDAYRAVPGLKGMGDRAYEQIRDNRYAWFGRRNQTYESQYPYSAESCKVCKPSEV